MADEAGAAEANSQNAQQQPQVQMRTLGQYIRDLSFENVMAQSGTGADGQPDINVKVNLDAKKRSAENQYEVAIKLNVESKVKGGDKVLFLMEIDYAGVFQIQGVPQEQLHPFLMIECPRIIFPFLRRIVHDVTRDGGYPPLNLDNIDFVTLYRNQLEQMKAQQKADA
ncbi:protein translocase subunit secB [Cribrihabitans marinus]|uniref:Protein-export protein SecB n=1 Tax=Cribrihabitans marinus TaxID=1227549 RepID=A0A1H6YG32_9RHOB|nr:protein-export chaperone SecB [Cribrihabitans marinus]GGH29178.1 protein-export protein SecB [Cribrihabitans marinus]SEJ40248.1 protein translocase subunit secB [Cribrihabitans marinus]